MTAYAARLSPLQGETVWSLEGAEIVERRAGRERRFPLSELRGVNRVKRGAVLQFRRRRLTIPALGYGELLRPQGQDEQLEAFLGALEDAAPGRRVIRHSWTAEALLWVMTLLAIGALALLLAAGVAGAWLLGVALASRLVFLVILGAAALPWLHSGKLKRPREVHEHDLN